MNVAVTTTSAEPALPSAPESTGSTGVDTDGAGFAELLALADAEGQDRAGELPAHEPPLAPAMADVVEVFLGVTEPPPRESTAVMPLLEARVPMLQTPSGDEHEPLLSLSAPSPPARQPDPPAETPVPTSTPYPVGSPIDSPPLVALADHSSPGAPAAAKTDPSQNTEWFPADPSRSGHSASNSASTPSPIDPSPVNFVHALEGVTERVPLEASTTHRPPVARADLDGMLRIAREHGAAVAKLQLHPRELGMVDTVMRQTPEGLTITLTAHQPAAAEALQATVLALRAQLHDAGVNVRSLDIAFGQGHAQHDSPGRHRRTSNGRPEDDTVTADDSFIVSRRDPYTLLDVRV